MVWYVFSPIAMFHGVLYKAIFYKTVQSIFLGLDIFILSRVFYEHRKWASWAMFIFVFASAPFVDYFDLRPEFLGTPFVILVTAFVIRAPKLGQKALIILGCLCAVNLFITPRLYPFILMAGLMVILSRNAMREKLIFVISGSIIAVLMILYFNLSDVYFFVFKVTRSIKPIPFSKLHYSSRFLQGMMLFLPVCIFLQLYGFRRGGIRIFVLNMLLLVLWFFEKLPYPAQSTVFIILMNFIFIFDYLLSRYKSEFIRSVAFGSLIFAICMLTYKFKIYKKFNVFDAVPYYESLITKCEGSTVQTKSIMLMMRPPAPGKLYHPLFVKDYTYFGHFQDDMFVDDLNEIMAYNQSKSIKYLEDQLPCLIDSGVAHILIDEINGSKK